MNDLLFFMVCFALLTTLFGVFYFYWLVEELSEEVEKLKRKLREAKR